MPTAHTPRPAPRPAAAAIHRSGWRGWALLALVMPLVLVLGSACSTPPEPAWPAQVVPIDQMQLAAPLQAQMSFRVKDSQRKGTAVFKLLVDDSGVVRRVQLLQSSGSDRIDEAAGRSAVAARFEPHRVDGQARAVTVLAPMHFH